MKRSQKKKIKLKYIEMMIPQSESEPVRSLVFLGYLFFWWVWGQFSQPLFFVQTIRCLGFQFACWLPQFAHYCSSCCLFSLLAHLQGHFLQKELHCLQANQVSELLLDTTSSWTQNCTSSNTLLPLYRLVCKEFSEVSILCYTRLDLQILPSLLWGKCTAGFGDFWIMGLCFWEQLWSSGE